jgi:hypothetical protein
MAKVFSVPDSLWQNLQLFADEQSTTNTYVDDENVLQLHPSASLNMLSAYESTPHELDLSKITLGEGSHNYKQALLEQRALINNDLDSEALRTQFFTQCTKPIQWQDTRFLIELIISFAKQCNIRVSDTLLDGCVHKIVIASFKTINPHLVLKTMNDTSACGDIISIHKRPNNTLGDYNEWKGLLDHMTFDKEAAEFMFSVEHEYGKEYPTIFHISRLLKELKVPMDAVQTLKLYVLVNVKGLKLLRAVQLFFSENLPINVNSEEAACIFAASLAEQTFEADVYSADVASILAHCTMSPQLKQDFTAFQHSDMQLQHAQPVASQANKSRTRLYDRVKNMTDSKHMATTTLSSSFEMWVSTVKLPSVSSGKKRGIAYLFMGLHELSKNKEAVQRNLKKLFKKDETVRLIMQHPVEHPEISVLVLLLKDITVVHPEADLLRFKKECLVDLSSQQQKALDFSTVFQLYICTYLETEIWKEVWKNFAPLSHNVLVNATRFRKSILIDLDYVTNTCVENFDLESK